MQPESRSAVSGCTVRGTHARVQGVSVPLGPGGRRRPRWSACSGLWMQPKQPSELHPTAPPAVPPSACLMQMDAFLILVPLAAAASMGGRSPRGPTSNHFPHPPPQKFRSSPAPRTHGARSSRLVESSTTTGNDALNFLRSILVLENLL